MLSYFKSWGIMFPTKGGRGEKEGGKKGGKGERKGEEGQDGKLRVKCRDTYFVTRCL